MTNITYNHEYHRKLRTAFIGCGSHAQRNVYPTFQYAPVDLVAVCDLDSSRADACGRQFGARKTYADYRQMLETEQPEVVFIVTNYDEHYRPRYPKLAIECMNAGAHAWIEKPPAASSAEIREMKRVSTQTGRHVGIGFKKMFFPANQKAQELSGRPEFGPITSITARYPQALPSLEDRTDARKMLWFLDHMVHPHSVLKYLAGDLQSLFVRRNETVSSAIASLQFKSGAIGTLHFSQGQSSRSFLERTEVIGDGANVIVENNTRVTYFRPDKPPGDYGRAGNYFAGDIDHAPLVWEPEFSLGQLYNKGIFLLGYASEVIHFTSRLLEGKGPEFGTLDDALELLKIYEAYLKADKEVVTVQTE
jgi:predicted dehydrogenase